MNSRLTLSINWWLKRRKGSVKFPEDFTSDKELVQDVLIEKYLGK